MREHTASRAIAERRKLLKLVAYLQGHGFTSASPDLRRQIAALFDVEGIEFQDLERVSADLLRQMPEIAGLIDRVARCAPLAPGDLRRLDEPLLHRAMRQTYLRDLVLEDLFARVRSQCLVWAIERPRVLEDHVSLLASLACQCFNNEYVYAISVDESRNVAVLEDLISQALPSKTGRTDIARIATCAMYRPLDELSCRDDLLALAGLDPDLDEVILLQLANPREERRLASTIPSFGTIVDPVSTKVRQQYEEYPYPRWLSIKKGDQSSLAKWISEMLPQITWQASAEPDILIAGCGTGKHPLRVGYRHPMARLLAIDISRASLAYAKRQALKFDISNVEFAHGDILSVARLGRSFDYIESIGVLHHMADLSEGLAELAGVLRPGGLIYVAIYSKRRLAKLSTVKDRFCTIVGDDRSPERFRAARRVIADMPDANEIPEFHYLSGLPDIFCPAHADLFTPAEVPGLIAGIDVDLVSFGGMDAEMEALYQARNSADLFCRDPEAVDRFEQQEPLLFTALMGFWLQKRL